MIRTQRVSQNIAIGGFDWNQRDVKENENNKKVGSAPDKDIKRGQKIGESTKKKGTKPSSKNFLLA